MAARRSFLYGRAEIMDLRHVSIIPCLPHFSNDFPLCTYLLMHFHGCKE